MTASVVSFQKFKNDRLAEQSKQAVMDLNYDLITRDALQGISINDHSAFYHAIVHRVIKPVLQSVEENGIPDNHAIYITFKVKHDGSILPPHIRRLATNGLLTIVIQNQWEKLIADDNGVAVTLWFNDDPIRIAFDWEAMTNFADKPAQFAMSFKHR